jgi:hypothetical protein
MAAFETGIVERCHWLGLDAAYRNRLGPIVRVRPDCASSGVSKEVTRPAFGIEAWGLGRAID